MNKELKVLITEQRYKFESNSQLSECKEFVESGCLLQSKDTNLKAIHNRNRRDKGDRRGAYYRAKIQI